MSKLSNVPVTRQGTLRCAGSTRRTSRCVSISFARYPCHVVFCGSADIASLWHHISSPFPEIKAIEEGIFDEKRYSLEMTLE